MPSSGVSERRREFKTARRWRMGHREAVRPKVGSVAPSKGERVPGLGIGPTEPDRGVVEKERAQITSR
jgi:hypothetical protein